MNRNSKIFTASTFPHTETSNILLYSGKHRNWFWIRNNSDRWVDPAGEYNRDKNIVTDPNIKIITEDEFDFPFIWEILEKNGYKARAVQIPLTLPPLSYNAKEETKYWFPYSEDGLYNNLRDKERITMNSLKDIADGNLDFYCTSFPEPDKLLHSGGEGHCSQEFILKELQYLDKVAKRIADFCNKKGINFFIYGDHGAPYSIPQFAPHYEQNIMVVRHRKHSVIISNYKGKIPGYTDEMFPWILKYFNIKEEKTVKKTKEQGLSKKEEEIVKDRLQKLGYL